MMKGNYTVGRVLFIMLVRGCNAIGAICAYQPVVNSRCAWVKFRKSEWRGTACLTMDTLRSVRHGLYRYACNYDRIWWIDERMVRSDGVHVSIWLPGYARSPFNSGNAIFARDKIARLHDEETGIMRPRHYLRCRCRYHIYISIYIYMYIDWRYYNEQILRGYI